MFTLNGKIQSHVDVYLTKRTMRWIANMFPYMVDTSKATGPPSVLIMPPTPLASPTALTPASAMSLDAQAAATSRASASTSSRTTSRRSPWRA